MQGKTAGKYRILDRVGRGGMGIVYKALDETLDREVAIKVLNPDIGDADLLKRFRAEAVSLARLNHPGIATIYELYRHGDDLLMVMEFVRGETLQTISERLGPLAPPQAAHLCQQVLDALAHAHRAGIIHRDLKPANVMVTDAGVVKVMDFGIARMMGGEHHTNTGCMMGTPAYMAPEQVLGHEVDHRADLYSVGVLFYRLLTRELPFKADTAIAIAQKQVAEAPTPLGTYRADLPPWCEAVIGRALAKSPGGRYQSAEEFRAAILASVSPVTLGELPTMATPTAAGLLRTADVSIPHGSGPHRTGASGLPATAPGTSAERTGTTVVLGRSHLFALATLVAVLVLALVALGVVVVKRGAATVSPPATTSPPATSPPTPEQPATPSPTVPAPAAAAPAAAESGPTRQQPAPPAATVVKDRAPRAPASASSTKPAKETPAPNTKEATEQPATAPPSDPAPPTTPVAASVVPALTFADVKMLVPEGDTRREWDVVLTLAGNRLSLLDRSTKAELLSLPYAAIAQASFSRSKQPKWKGPDGKEASVSVNFGKMGFFRGDRNWVIFTTRTDPVFLRFEDRNLAQTLKAIEERTGIKIQR